MLFLCMSEINLQNIRKDASHHTIQLVDNKEFYPKVCSSSAHLGWCGVIPQLYWSHSSGATVPHVRLWWPTRKRSRLLSQRSSREPSDQGVPPAHRKRRTLRPSGVHNRDYSVGERLPTASPCARLTATGSSRPEQRRLCPMVFGAVGGGRKWRARFVPVVYVLDTGSGEGWVSRLGAGVCVK